MGKKNRKETGDTDHLLEKNAESQKLPKQAAPKGSGQVIKVFCKCSYYLFRYYKDQRGQLIKLYLGMILEDNVGVQGVQNNEHPVCPNCKRELGVVGIVHGKPAIQVNRATINLRT